MLSEFPQLRGYEREIDKIPVTMLIQAKFYQKKKLRKSPGVSVHAYLTRYCNVYCTILVLIYYTYRHILQVKKPTELRRKGSKVKANKVKAKKGKEEVKTSKEVLGGSYKPG